MILKRIRQMKVERQFYTGIFINHFCLTEKSVCVELLAELVTISSKKTKSNVQISDGFK
jgi:hypothetical protein